MATSCVETLTSVANTADGLILETLTWRKRLEFYVNQKRIVVDDAQPHQTLLWFLRTKLGLTGTKLGCGEGGCGACTVVVAHLERNTGRVLHRTVNACLAPLCSVDGQSVITVEGIGTSQAPHPVQQRIADCHGSQCGFCTPGIVMSLYGLLSKNNKPSLAELETAFDGNLCRCTGYRPILDAAKTFAHDKETCPSTPLGFECSHPRPCQEGDANVCSTTSAAISSVEATFATAANVPFPKALSETHSSALLKVEGSRVTWYRPDSLAVLLALKKSFPQAKLVAGNSEVGIETKFKMVDYPVMISTAAVPELHELAFGNNGSLNVGGAVTLTDLEHHLEHFLAEHKLSTASGMRAMLDMIRWFASVQIRNVAVLAGNIVTASPISDLIPVLMALDAKLVMASACNGPREVLVCDFLKSYRVVELKPDEVLCSVHVPAPDLPNGVYEFVRSYKQAKRRDDDISIVNACLRVQLEPTANGWTVLHVRAVFGGMAATTKRAKHAEAAFLGQPWGQATLDSALKELTKDVPLEKHAPGGMAAYRQTLAASFMFKFFNTVSLELARKRDGSMPSAPDIADKDISSTRNFLSEDPPVTHGSQSFHVPSGGLQQTAAAGGKDHDCITDTSRAPVGQPLSHRSALPQCTGEAKYVDDMPSIPGTLHAAMVLSERAHARILSVDTSDAEALPGVTKVFTASDLSDEQNMIGPILPDEELLRRTTVQSTGQPIACVVAESVEVAQRATRLVKVQYQDLKPILTIEDAIREKSFHTPLLYIEDGDVDAAFAMPDTVQVEGEIRIGAQEHFYLETNATLVEPGESDEITVYTSTQNPMKAQKFAAIACGIPFSKVVCRMKRMGGGFGGKETRTVFISSLAAFAAHRLRKPVRINVERDVDMWITGGRHPFLAKYRAGADPDGKLRALDVKIYNNAGYSLDLSEPVLARALFHLDNSYKVPNLRAVGHLCFTNTVSNTAFRGFGGPQGLLVCEAWMEHLATALKMQPEQLRARNLYPLEGSRTHFLQLLHQCPLQRMWKELSSSAEVEGRIAQVQEFNQQNRWRKRGIAMLPTKFGISFTAKFMNQAGALVHIYTDGTVLVTHGGTEMGQGLHTKMIQVVARAFEIPLQDVTIRETSTDTVPNSSPTAASASSDLYGMALLNACDQLKGRLQPYLEKAGGNFKSAVNTAYFDRCDLSAHGFYKPEGIGYDWSNPKSEERGTPFNYFTHGAACSEVEVDVLTGDMRIMRADILMDFGNSLNPAIDIGQVEGAFMQGVGWCTIEEVIWGCEELKWLKPGQCFTRGPGNYKIPSFNDVPVDFRVTLLKDSANPKAIHSSRAVGEPPLFLGASVFFAIRQAIASARVDAGHRPDEHFIVDSPLTPERIRMACGDKMATDFAEGSSRPAGFW